MFGIQRDFARAEIEFVPALKARDVGRTAHLMPDTVVTTEFVHIP